jgi:hypothetical protein
MEQFNNHHVKESKVSQNASTKVMSVVNKVLLPLLSAPLGDSVSFQVKDISDLNQEYFKSLSEMEPEVVKDKTKFLQTMTDIYERHQRT